MLYCYGYSQVLKFRTVLWYRGNKDTNLDILSGLAWVAFTCQKNAQYQLKSMNKGQAPYSDHI
jgi:hypothetical protein